MPRICYQSTKIGADLHVNKDGALRDLEENFEEGTN